MLGAEKELERGGFGEMCVYLQRVAILCCSTLPDVRFYLKSHQAMSAHVMCMS